MASSESYFINIKFFRSQTDEFNQEVVVPIFHRWIKDRRLDDLLIDVADYRHVHQGPGVMLIAHEANYSLDLAQGKLGLLYAAKRPHSGSLAQQLKQAFRSAAKAAALLEQEPDVVDKLSFKTDSVLLRIHNRLFARNHPEDHAQRDAEVQAALKEAVPLAQFSVQSTGQVSDPFSLTAVAANTISLADF